MADTDTTQQVTSKVPITRVKNPKRVAAGKAIAEKRRQAQEAQKKKMAEADVIVARDCFTNFDNYTIAKRHQHRHFIGRPLLQTR